MTAKIIDPKRTLILFVKPPQPGEVKTRLLPHLTGLECAELYACFVRDILTVVSKLNGIKLLVGYQPQAKYPDLSWTGLKSLPETFKQEGKSLGERLVHAFGIAFGRGAQRVAVMGSDSPTLDTAHITQAFKSLEKSDLVLGPVTDGGYYLIGLSRPSLKIFEEVSWSNDQIFERTSQNAQRLGHRLLVLPTHYNINTIDDLLKLHQELAKHPTRAPHTERYLSGLLKNKRIFAAA